MKFNAGEFEKEQTIKYRTYLTNNVTEKLIKDLKHIEENLPICAERRAVEYLRIDLVGHMYNNKNAKPKNRNIY